MSGITAKTPLSPRATGTLSILEAQRIKKIRVNRVSLIQELRVEYVLDPLVQRGVLSSSEKDFILQGTSLQDKTRRLVDLLPTKGKTIDWFNIFRDVLKEPDGDELARSCCQRIVSYLDNTIIARPKDIIKTTVPCPVSQTDKSVKRLSYPKYQPLPDIGKDSSTTLVDAEFTSRQSVVRFNLDNDTKREEFELETNMEESQSGYEEVFSDAGEIDIGQTISLRPRRLWRSITVEPYFRKPSQLFDMLQKGECDGDLQQLAAEEQVWRNLIKLEVPVDLFQEKKLQGQFDLLLCKEMFNILTDSCNHHLYLKYLNQLKYEKYFDLLKELESMYVDIFEHIKPVENKETRDHIMEIGFGLTSLLELYAYYSQAETTMSTLIQYLCTKDTVECWVPQFNAHVKLLGVRIACLEFTLADHAYYAAQKVAQKVENMTCGQDTFNSAELYTLTSTLMRQRGSIAPAFTWSQKALQEVDPYNHTLIINIMCEAVKAYCAKWKIKDAEDLAVEAIKQAKKYFGTNHPLYLKALLHYCHYSCLFRRDTLGVNVAMYALEIAQKIYGITEGQQDIDLINSTLPLAHSHRELAKSIGLCKTGVMNPALGFDHAYRAYRMALDILPGLHPTLSKFRYSLACCVLWKDHSGASETKVKEEFEWAKSKVKESLRDAKDHFGDISLKVAKLHGLLGQIYVRTERFEDAETELKTSVQLLKYCLPHNSNHIYVAEGALATLYKYMGRPSDAVEVYKEVVGKADTDGIYCDWLDSSFVSLIELLQATDETELADEYRAKHVDWSAANRKLPDLDLWARLDMPPMEYEELLTQLHLWTNRQSTSYSGTNLSHTDE